MLVGLINSVSVSILAEPTTSTTHTGTVQMCPTSSFGLDIYNSINRFLGNAVLSPHEEPVHALSPPCNIPDRSYPTISQVSEQPSSISAAPFYERGSHRSPSVLGPLAPAPTSETRTPRQWDTTAAPGPPVVTGADQSLPCLSHCVGMEGYHLSRR